MGGGAGSLSFLAHVLMSCVPIIIIGPLGLESACNRLDVGCGRFLLFCPVDVGHTQIWNEHICKHVFILFDQSFVIDMDLFFCSDNRFYFGSQLCDNKNSCSVCD